jgi:F-type H+-transporting ATPase subunit delta
LTDYKVTRRYAKALLALGKEDGKYDLYGKEIQAFAGLLAQEPLIKETLSNPLYDMELRRKILKTILDKMVLSPMVSNFLNLLLDKRRIAFVSQISQFYSKLTDELVGIARAKVISALTLPEEMIARVKQALEELTKKTVLVETRVDPAIIGGLVAKVGDLSLDGSIKSQLTSLKESLKRGEI